VNFATSGDPNGKGLPAWTAYELAEEAYLDLGDAVQYTGSRSHGSLLNAARFRRVAGRLTDQSVSIRVIRGQPTYARSAGIVPPLERSLAP